MESGAARGAGGGRRELLVLAALSLLWWLPVLWIGVRGEFPLYDDWAYARSVQTWLLTGSFARPAFIVAPTVSNALIGLFFTKLFGFSFAVLRVSNLVMGWLALGATYALARSLKARVEAAALAAACLAVCPLFFHLSYTFMTDIAFTAFTTAGLLVAARIFVHPSPLALAALGGLSVAAVLSRNAGLALPISAVGAFLLLNWRRRGVWIVALACVLTSFAFYWFSPLLFAPEDSGTRVPILRYVMNALRNPGLLFNVLRNGASSLLLLGLFAAPLWLAGGFRDLGRGGRTVAAATAGLGAFGLWRLGLQPPFGLDQIRDFGLGALTQHGAESLPHAPVALWYLIAVAGFACAASSLWRIAAFAKTWHWRSPEARAALPAWLFVCCYLAPLGIHWPFFDRWLIPAVPVLLALLAASTPVLAPGPPRLLAPAALCLLLLFSAVGTRDQLDLKRAQANLTAEVEAMGVAPDHLDGGSAYNAWHHYRSVHNHHSRSPRSGHRWVHDDEVVISFASKLAGYAPIASRTVRMRLPPAEVTIRAFLRRSSPLQRTSAKRPGSF